MTGTTTSVNVNATRNYKYYRLSSCDSSGTVDTQSDISEFQITAWYTNTYGNLYTLDNSILSYQTGQRVALKIPSSYVGGGIALNINGLGYKNVVVDDINANERILLYYNGTNFVLDN